MMVYISHAYGGKEENKAEIEAIIGRLVKADPEQTYISPVHAYGFLYADVPYDTGMKYCTDLLAKCEEMWVFGEHSRGVMEEIKFCEENGIPWFQIE